MAYTNEEQSGHINESFEITVNKGSKFATITVKSSDQVSEIRNKYTDKEGVKTKGSRLFYQGKPMLDGKLLADYGIFPGSGSIPIVTVVMTSDGGTCPICFRSDCKSFVSKIVD